MKKFLFLFLMVGALFLTSCGADTETKASDEGVVVFKIANLMDDDKSNKSFAKSSVQTILPNCSDKRAKRVKAVIDGKEYSIRIVDGQTLETNELKLPAGNYTVSSFGVFDANDVAIYAQPAAGSTYATLFNIPTQFSFVVKPFQKVKTDVNVICYEAPRFQEFGFEWFQFVKHEVKEKCFYVNLCRENFEEWHAEGSPYFGQEYDGRYFSGIIEVTIKGDGWSSTETNAEYFGNGKPLCVPYIDKIGSEDAYSYEINLLLPDGGKALIHAGAFADSTKKFGGVDGVLDLRVGCKDLPPTDCNECDVDCDPEVISNEKVEICHKLKIGNDWKFINLTVPASAVDAHLKHGDELGSCK